MADERKFPAVTVVLIGLNLAVAFAVEFAPALKIQAAFDPLRPQLLNALTCLFAHSGVVHLLANMVFLAAVGPLVEFSRGGWRLAVVYLVAGLFGVGAHWIGVREAGDGSLLMGASGSIAGCVGYCSVRFARVRVPIFPKVGVPVALIAVVWVVLQATGLVIGLGEPALGGTAFWAHLGGFVAGIVLSVPLGGLAQARRQYGHELLEKMNSRGPAATVAAADALLQKSPDNPDVLWQKATALANLDEFEQSAAVALQMLALPNPDEPRIVQHLAQIDQLGVIDSVTHLKLADRLAKSNPELAERLLVFVSESDPGQRPEALLALAQLHAPQQSETFNQALEQLRHEYPVHPATEVARQKGWIS